LKRRFHAALGEAGNRNDLGYGRGVAVVLGEPLLAGPHDRIRMRLRPHQRRIRQLTLAVPLEQVDLGNAQSLARAHMPRNDVQREVVPRRGATGGYDPARRVGEHQRGLRPEPDLREPGPK
jgi:hypothetical protein